MGVPSGATAVLLSVPAEGQALAVWEPGVAASWGCKTVVCDLMISMVSPGVSVLQSFHTSPAFPVLALLECSTRLQDKTGEMVVK